MPAKKEAHHHRAGGLKQANKSFKTRFATKSSIKDVSKGKVQRVSVKSASRHVASKSDRKNASRLAQKAKRDALVTSKRIFTGKDGVYKTVLIVSMCPDVETRAVLQQLYQAEGQILPDSVHGCTTLVLEHHKQTLQFLHVERGHVMDTVDAAVIADYVVPVFSATVEADEYAAACCKNIQLSGVPTVLPCVYNLEEIPLKKRNQVKKSLLSYAAHFFPNQDKLFTLDNDADVSVFIRTIVTQLPRVALWKETRPYMVANNIHYFPVDEQVGTLAVTGYARGGTRFSANRLVYLPGYGDFMVDKITQAAVVSHGMQVDEQVLSTRDEAQADTLLGENEPDTLQNEQTWPTEEELAEGDRNMNEAMKRVKRVPKGTSAYQAAWILDDDEDEVDSQFDTEDDEEDYEDAPQEEHTVDTDDVAMDDDESVMGMDDAQEQERQLQQYLAERSTRHLEQLEFPDEVDTPIDVPARTRFQKYRGLESFRTSAWDPYENLPLDYGRIFQFENYKRTRARVLQQSTEEGVMPNTPITLYISNVPRQLVESSTTTPFYVYGLHQHEHKMSVVHFVIQRDAEYEGIIKSKDPLMLQYGCRRYRVQPLYSEHARGGGKGENNVHKFERFLQPNATVVCTVYAPITFGKQVPVLLYTDSTVPKLVASGALLRVEPERILAKRIILTGHPFKVHKRTAVVRYMFFQPEDIVWFKPVQLVTKHGRLGHIYESLGTHGYMKCRFDGGIKQHDTICMRLYKRVFPKWTTVLWQPNFEGMDIE